MNRYVTGAVAGTVGSIFHTAVMLALHRGLPRARRDPVPPVEITSVVAGHAGLHDVRQGPKLTAATALLHFGYGAAAGSLYAPVAPRRRTRPMVSGAAFGLGVWAASYLGWLPALGILAPATRHPAQRNAMMILAHVAWGAALGAVFARLRRPSTAPRSPAPYPQRRRAAGAARHPPLFPSWRRH